MVASRYVHIAQWIKSDIVAPDSENERDDSVLGKENKLIECTVKIIPSLVACNKSVVIADTPAQNNHVRRVSPQDWKNKHIKSY